MYISTHINTLTLGISLQGGIHSHSLHLIRIRSLPNCFFHTNGTLIFSSTMQQQHLTSIKTPLTMRSPLLLASRGIGNRSFSWTTSNAARVDPSELLSNLGGMAFGGKTSSSAATAAAAKPCIARGLASIFQGSAFLPAFVIDADYGKHLALVLLLPTSQKMISTLFSGGKTLHKLFYLSLFTSKLIKL